ncbi:MAG: UpxY family transcription antiterminator [Planctomycetes bacterium]|nr:UpxY family transcription antiterminator [Planctomycetota bacterium]MBL7044476.1 UpxY family transcription antiterminator [Pirellulaceae bacterium]
MPILAKEQDVHPVDLFDRFLDSDSDEHRWWALYTLSRREKELMRRLHAMDVAFYGPLIRHRYRSPAGRVRTSYVPLFPNYVFVCGNEFHRYEAVTTGCVCRDIEVGDGIQLASDLQRISRLIETGQPLTPESRLKQGRPVRVLSGPFAGFEGTVVRRENQTRLLVAVNFMEQGASVLLEDCQLEPLD